MILSIAKSADLPVPLGDAWSFVRDPVRVAACIASLERFEPATAPGRFDALLVERLGPFSVRVPLTIAVSEDAAGQVMVAAISGEDRAGQARVRGEVRATVLAGDGGGSRLEVSSEMEVLGRLASLGAVPIRRRGDQVFEAFVAALRSALGGGDG
jgi:carbon monoxide dehydrogenase subunit G